MVRLYRALINRKLLYYKTSYVEKTIYANYGINCFQYFIYNIALAFN
jgi:hypothetical protein